MAHWVQELPLVDRLQHTNIGVYGALIAALITVAVARSTLGSPPHETCLCNAGSVFFRRAIRSAQHLHDNMFQAVVRSASFLC